MLKRRSAVGRGEPSSQDEPTAESSSPGMTLVGPSPGPSGPSESVNDIVRIRSVELGHDVEFQWKIDALQYQFPHTSAHGFGLEDSSSA